MNSTSHTSGSIPGVGKVELSWVANAPATAGISAVATNGSGSVAESKMDMDRVKDEPANEEGEMDYDVADEGEEARWR